MSPFSLLFGYLVKLLHFHAFAFVFNIGMFCFASFKCYHIHFESFRIIFVYVFYVESFKLCRSCTRLSFSLDLKENSILQEMRGQWVLFDFKKMVMILFKTDSLGTKLNYFWTPHFVFCTTFLPRQKFRSPPNKKIPWKNGILSIIEHVVCNIMPHA